MLHDNAYPHIAVHTFESLRQLKFEVLKHPPYSPDLAHDYHMFGPLKDASRGRRFASNQEAKETLHELLVTQPKTLTTAAYRGYTRSKYLQRTYVRAQLSNGVLISGHRD
jgi:hypothetical protein